jgi:hypothetical protein
MPGVESQVCLQNCRKYLIKTLISVINEVHAQQYRSFLVAKGKQTKHTQNLVSVARL